MASMMGGDGERMRSVYMGVNTADKKKKKNYAAEKREQMGKGGGQGRWSGGAWNRRKGSQHKRGLMGSKSWNSNWAKGGLGAMGKVRTGLQAK